MSFLKTEFYYSVKKRKENDFVFVSMNTKTWKCATTISTCSSFEEKVLRGRICFFSWTDCGYELTLSQ